jgi:outer membrane DcaP-like protein
MHNGIRALVCISVLALVANCAEAQPQQSGNVSLEQMKDKLQNLQPQIQDLRTQINAAQQKRQRSTDTAAKFTPEEAKNANAPEGPKSSTRNVDLYGFVMLDSGYDFGQSDASRFDVVRPTRLPCFPGKLAPDGKVVFGLRLTGCGLKTPTPTGDLKTHVEFELFGSGIDAGQTIFRPRHVYGQLGQFGAGQTWTLFVDPDLFPNEVQYWGASGIAWFRNVQVRWMPIRKQRMHLTFATEVPGASADEGIYAQGIELQNVKPKVDTPDFSWQFRDIGYWGYVQLAGRFRKISWVDDLPNPMFHLGGDSLGWGLNLGSNVNLTRIDIERLTSFTVLVLKTTRTMHRRMSP